VSSTENLHELPAGITPPTDDGGCDHLPGIRLPPVALPSTTGERVDLSGLPGRTVVYCYPRTGRPYEDLPRGWDEIPGARGCTPQSCSFRDHHAEIRAFDVRVFGLSTQSTGYQREAADRLHLPFDLLSDEELASTSKVARITDLRGGGDDVDQASDARHRRRPDRDGFLPCIPARRECTGGHRMAPSGNPLNPARSYELVAGTVAPPERT
jgi:peroxiredoxin